MVANFKSPLNASVKRNLTASVTRYLTASVKRHLTASLTRHRNASPATPWLAGLRTAVAGFRTLGPGLARRSVRPPLCRPTLCRPLDRPTLYRPAPTKGRRRQHGMALMEALVAILIFAFGVLGLIGLEASAINFAVDADDRNRAALFASEVASGMWLAGTTDKTSAQLAPQYSAWQTSVADPTKTGLTNGTLNINTVTSNSADIVITWKPPSRAAAAAASQLTTRVILP